MQRYKAMVEYVGTNYCGMQKQNDTQKKSIQEVLETAISKFANKVTSIDYSGRTDSGVHAIGQVIHFDLEDDRDEYNVLHGINFYLTEEDIIVKSVSRVDYNFHSRFSAKSRVYLYRVLNTKVNSPLLKNRVFFYPYNIDIVKMQEAAKKLTGKKMDFASFCSAESVNNVNTFKTIDRINIYTNNEEIYFEFEAKSFLHNMIRIMVGVLLQIGRNKINGNDLHNILLQKKRPNNCNTAPAHGLYFSCVRY